MELKGPSDDTFRKLAGMIPGIADGMNSGQIGGGDTNPKGSKVCVACSRMFGRTRNNGELKPDVCKTCRKVLLDGGTIFICDDQRILVVRSKDGTTARIAEKYQGRIVKVPNSFMDQLYDAAKGKPENPSPGHD